jgi:hypothetical protein
MNSENNEVQVPNYEGEKMKMPENSVIKNEMTEESTVVSSPILITLTVLLVIILGGMYYWFNTINSEVPVITPDIERPTAAENNEPESTTAEAQVETMQTTSTSDEIEAIEADLEATNLDSLDSELQAIDAEFEAEVSNN